MPIFKISLAFSSYSNPVLVNFTGGVTDGMTANPAFPTPGVSMLDLTTACTGLTDAMAAAALGGPVQTALQNQARMVLIGLLRQEANYVQGASNNHLPTMLSSGFGVNSTNRSSLPLDTPVVLEIDNGMTTQLVARVQGVDNARAYEVQVKNGTGGWVAAGIFTQPRNMILNGLTPGNIYSVQVRAVGGSTGYSAWTDPVSHMAM